MATNTLIEKISAEAEAEVAKIKATANAEVEKIQVETESALEALRAEAATVLAKKKEQQELVATSKAKQEGKLKVQRTKRAKLDELFAGVYEELVGQSSDDYVAFFTAQAKQTLPDGVTAPSVTAPQNRLDETKQILATLGLQAEIKGSDALSAGFIVTATDGVYDVTFNRIFELKRSELEMEVVSEFLK